MLPHAVCAQACADIYDPLSSWANVLTGKVTLGHKVVDGVHLVTGRGSDNPGDWFHDLAAIPFDHPRLGIVHEGLYDGIASAYSVMCQWLSDGAPIVFSGHSMGASHVTYLAANALLDSMPVRQIVLFGSPRSGWLKLANIIDGAVDCSATSYRHGSDPVPDVPTWPFRHAVPLRQIGYSPDPIRIMDHSISRYVAAVRTLEQSADQPAGNEHSEPKAG